MDNFKFRRRCTGTRDVELQPDAQPAIPEPGRPCFAGGALLRSLLCRCGTAWALTRVPTRHVVQEQMDCLCGETLLQWAECADYIFEPISMVNSIAN